MSGASGITTITIIATTATTEFHLDHGSEVSSAEVGCVTCRLRGASLQRFDPELLRKDRNGVALLVD